MISGNCSIVALVLACVPTVLAAQRAPSVDLHGDDVARIREATAAFRDVDAARAAGYPRSIPDRCIQSNAGIMGYHFVNPDLMDDRLELERPEILVYAPTADGGLKLAGVEYAVPYSAWDRREAPRIMGQALRRADDLQIWYLHVWVWEENPDGMLADWNPALSCSP